MEPETPTRPTGQQGARTPISKVLHRVEELTPQLSAGPIFSPFGSPALLRLGEAALRERLREAYGLLKEKEKNLFLAATVGQELLDANQQLQDDYESVRMELAETQTKLKELGRPLLPRAQALTDEELSHLHGRRRSMVLSQQHSASQNDQNDKKSKDGDGKNSTIDDDENGDSERERLWIKTHVQPLKIQFQLAQERTDELLAEREDLAAQVYGLQQEHSAALRRASESNVAAEEARRRLEGIEEEKAQLQEELSAQREFWAGRWSEHKEQCKAGTLEAEKNAKASAGKLAEDAAARIRAERRADDLQVRYNAVQAELELFRNQMQRMEEERINEWEPMRARWLSCEEALQELQETHQSTCEALAQAETRLAELDPSTELNDPIKLKSEKTSTSLLGELDLQRHKAVSQQQALAHEHTVLKRAYTRALSTQARMKQQVARLTQLAATGASEVRMKRLEAALGEAECQKQALFWASMGQRRSLDIHADTECGSPEADGTALVIAMRARLKQTIADRDQTQRELRTAHLLRANEMQRTRELEREAAEAESKLRRAMSELTVLRSDYEFLRRSAKSSKKHLKPPSNDSKPTELLDSPQIAPVDTKASAAYSLPRRKRTRSGSPFGGSPAQMKSGPMSLAFMINADSAVTAKAANAKQPQGSPLGSSRKRQRHINEDANSSPVEELSSGSLMRGADELTAASNHRNESLHGNDKTAAEHAAISKEVRELSDFSNAADRGIKSWLESLGAAHASATMTESESVDLAAHGIGTPKKTKTPTRAPGGSNSKNNAKAKSNVHTDDNTSGGTVEEIYLGSRMAQKPIECNNQ
ncbi:hypothetical protein BX070DRAFT_109844 [Coemansia spiralis]|nr:hypothetical protein BX070DRAFT_109844 [Coemansia spiralis]